MPKIYGRKATKSHVFYFMKACVKLTAVVYWVMYSIFMKVNLLKTIFTALLLLCSIVASAHDIEEGGIYYRITDYTAKTVAVTYAGSDQYEWQGEYSGDVTIPSSVYGYSVTSIGDCAFTECPDLTSVTIPVSVTSIGDAAFCYCHGLTSVTIPASVISIGAGAFSGCSSLTSVRIPESVKSIGEGTFRGCSSLADITIPESVTSIGYYAFHETAWYNNLPDGEIYIGKLLYCYKGTMPIGTSINVKEGTIEIGDYAFSYCTGLVSIIIPNSVTSIGYAAFQGCSSLNSVTMSNGITRIEDGTFLECTGLTNVTIPESVTSIGSCAFQGCTGMSSITIPKGVKRIENSAFNYCTGLTNVTIPASITAIDAVAFEGCTGLTEVHISDLVTWCNINFGNAYANPLYYAGNLYLNGEKVTNLVIPSNITSIGSSAFYKCTSLTSLTIPSSITSIGNTAFFGCTGLTSVTIPEGVTNIGSGAFNYCTSLARISIPESVTSIERGAFDNTAWYNNQPDGVIYIGKNLNGYKGIMPEGTNINVKEGTLNMSSNAFKGCTGLAGITIPESVTNIGESVFNGCSGLTSVTIPSRVTSIGKEAFYRCTNLVSIIIPESVTSIGDAAFHGTAWYNNQPDGVIYIGKVLYEYKGAMPKGTSINIKEGTLRIAPWAFSHCRNLTSITIPESVTSIESCAFYDCSNLSRIDVPESVTSIGSSAFYNTAWYNNKPDGVIYIGKVLYEYKGTIPQGTNISVKEGTLSITSCAFEDCRNLTSITIPESVTNIGNQAFYNCTGLTSITSLIPAESLFTIDNLVFYFVNNGTLYVPAGAKATYEITKGWNRITNIVEIESGDGETNSVEDVKSENGRVKGVYYDLGGRVVENPTSGIYIIDGKKVMIR